MNYPRITKKCRLVGVCSHRTGNDDASLFPLKRIDGADFQFGPAFVHETSAQHFALSSIRCYDTDFLHCDRLQFLSFDFVVSDAFEMVNHVAARQQLPHVMNH